MSKVLYANGNDGRVAIMEASGDINNPLGNLGNMYFHSALDYLYIRSVLSGSISLPQRDASGSDASSAYGSTTYNLGYHGLGFKPMVFGYLSNAQPIVGDCFVNAGGSASIRTVTIGADENYIYAREIFLNKDVTFSAYSFSYTVFVFNNPGL